MKDIHILRLKEFAKHLIKKEFLKPKGYGAFAYLKFMETNTKGNRIVKIKTRKFILDALIAFHEWNFNDFDELIYKNSRDQLINYVEYGIHDFFKLSPSQMAHVLDIQDGKHQRIQLFGGKKLTVRSKPKDFSWNIKKLLEKMNQNC